MQKHKSPKLIRPHAVVVSCITKTNSRKCGWICNGVFLFYIISFAVISCLLLGLGLDLVTAISGAASAIGNVGQVRQIIGPSGSYQSSQTRKLILCQG